MPAEIVFSPDRQGMQPFGGVAEALLACNMNTGALRTNTVLRKDEWKQMDTAILKAVRSRLIGVADLKSKGLVFDLGPNALATMQLEYENASKLGRATISMDGETQGRRDRITFGLGYLPIPIIHQDYSLNARVLAASRLRQSKLDTSTAVEAATTVAEEIEIMLFQGTSSFSFGSGVIYGYTDVPNRSTGTFTAWTASGADPVANIMTMKQALITNNFFGPYMVYIPTAYETALDANYVTGAAAVNITVRERIMKIGNIQDIKVADYLTAGAVVMVQMTENVVRMVSGLGVQNVEWKGGGGMRTNFKVLTIDVPQIRSTKDSKVGVAHYTAA